MIWPGVVCTKAPAEYGPCTKGRGQPDPAQCKAYCAHRLELPRAKVEAQRVIKYLVEKISDEKVSDLAKTAYRSQLRQQLARWDDVREWAVAHYEEALQAWREDEQ